MTQRTMLISSVFAAGVLLSLQTAAQRQTCRSLDEKVLYQYDATHRIYADSAVVLSASRMSNQVVSIVIAAKTRIGGQLRGSILHSEDMGHHWLSMRAREIPTPLALAASDFAQAPSNPAVQYKYIQRTLSYERSDDGGVTWKMPRNAIGQLGPTEGYDEFALAAINPSKPLEVFATIRRKPANNGTPTNEGLYRSKDGGGHWEKVSATIEFGTPVGIDPSNPSVMYGYGTAGVLGVLKTSDGGATWALTPQQRLMEQRPVLVAERNGQQILGIPTGISVSQFAIDPKSTTFVYIVSTKGIYRSENGGESWCLLNTGSDFLDSTYSLAFDPNDTAKIFAGTRFGVLYSPDRGNTFTRIYPTKDR